MVAAGGCARIGGVGLHRDLLRFNAPRTGRASMVKSRSINADHKVVGRPGPGGRRRRALAAQGLARWLLETFAISLDETTVGRELKALGSKMGAAAPLRAKRAGRPRLLKKIAELAKIRARLPTVEIELWWR